MMMRMEIRAAQAALLDEAPRDSFTKHARAHSHAQHENGVVRTDAESKRVSFESHQEHQEHEFSHGLQSKHRPASASHAGQSYYHDAPAPAAPPMTEPNELPPNEPQLKGVALGAVVTTLAEGASAGLPNLRGGRPRRAATL